MRKLNLAILAATVLVAASPALASAATPPDVTTGNATPVGHTTATLNGTVNPNGADTRYYFQWGSKILNKRTPVRTTNAGTAPIAVRAQITPLKPGTRYIYRLVATNAQGTVRGDTRELTTVPSNRTTPGVSTGGARDVTATGATLAGSINTRGQTGTYFFEYGLTTSYGATTTPTPFGPTTQPTQITSPVAGLTPQRRYHYRLVFQTQDGGVTRGRDRTFTTRREPNGLLIEATPNPVRYGAGTQIGGILAGSGNSGVEVTVQADPFPFDGAWSTVASGRTDATGAYLITVSPLLANVQLRTVAATSPQVVSQAVTVGVRARVSLRVNKRRPARGARVRFRGRVTPSQDGARVLIQRRSRGAYRTIARTRVDGSRYSRRVRINKRGRYRVKVRSTSASLLAGFSRSRVLRVR